MEIRDIKQILVERVEQVAKYLFPQGRLVGREWEVGSIHGEPGRSLKVCVSGGKVGVWTDFAAGQGGDLIDLWREVRGLSSNGAALKEIREYLGIADPHFERTKQKEYRKPQPPKETKKASADDRVMRYLTEERKLTPETIDRYKIGSLAQVGPWSTWKRQQPARGPWIVFPFFRDGDLLSMKYLHLERKEGKKFTLVEPGCEPTCFGWHVIDPKARELVICEGEIDAATLWQYGWPAVSVPFGGGKGDKQQWVDGDWDTLAQFETIYLCMDTDKEGEAAVAELTQRLGIHRCRIVTLPQKDANDCLKAGAPKATIDQCFAEARYIEPEELRRANEFRQEVIATFYPEGGKLPGFDAPWHKVPFRFLRGEVSVVTGINGHGKSLLWNQVVLAATMQGERACIASMEMAPKMTLHRVVRQTTGRKLPSKDVITECLDWLSDKIWIFNLVGTAKVDRMLQTFEYAFRRHGIKQFVIDSLMKCGIAEDDYKGQKMLLERLCDFAAKTGAHVYLVAHSRKGDDELTPAGKMDVKGTGAITDLAFNVFSVWRNKRKEQIMKAVAADEPVELKKGETVDIIRESPDAFLFVEKARNVEGIEGKYSLWYDAPSMQYIEKRTDRPVIYFKTRKQEEEEDAPF